MSMTSNAAKTCTKCGIEQDRSCFGKDKCKKDGLTPPCRTCRRIASRLYYSNNKEKCNALNMRIYSKVKNTQKFQDARYANHIKRNYGITLEEYNDMFIEQGGRCAICGRHQAEFTRRLLVDHNHETGVLRGLLCYNCNTGLGQFGDKLQLVKNTVKYLEMNNVDGK